MSERKDEGARELVILVGVLLAAVVGVGATVWVSADRSALGPEPGTVTVAVAAPGIDGGPAVEDEARPAVTPVPTTTPPGSVIPVGAPEPRGRVVMPAPVGAAVAVGAVAAAVVDGPVYHADVYFDFKSTRLRADAVRVLQEHAALMEAGRPWGVLIQGHADLHGPAEYNRALAQRRADVVKQFLVELGVPEPSIRVVTVGQDGALCEDATAECQQLNRRVHIEIRKLPGTATGPVRATVVSGDVVGPMGATLRASRVDVDRAHVRSAEAVAAGDDVHDGGLGSLAGSRAPDGGDGDLAVSAPGTVTDAGASRVRAGSPDPDR